MIVFLTFHFQPNFQSSLLLISDNFVLMLKFIMVKVKQRMLCKQLILLLFFLARLHEVHRAIAVTPVVHVPVPVRVPVRVTLALKFSRSPYLDNHSSESIPTWTIDTL